MHPVSADFAFHSGDAGGQAFGLSGESDGAFNGDFGPGFESASKQDADAAERDVAHDQRPAFFRAAVQIRIDERTAADAQGISRRQTALQATELRRGAMAVGLAR